MNAKTKTALVFVAGLLIGGSAILGITLAVRGNTPKNEGREVKPLTLQLPAWAIDYNRQPDGTIILTAFTGMKYLTTEAELTEYNECQKRMDEASKQRDEISKQRPADTEGYNRHVAEYNHWLKKRPKMIALEK